MSNEELLAEAYRRYPLGSRFMSIHNENIVRVAIPYGRREKNIKYIIRQPPDEKTAIVYTDNGCVTDNGGCSNPTLYKNGKWCPVLEGDSIEQVRDWLYKDDY